MLDPISPLSPSSPGGPTGPGGPIKHNKNIVILYKTWTRAMKILLKGLFFNFFFF